MKYRFLLACLSVLAACEVPIDDQISTPAAPDAAKPDAAVTAPPAPAPDAGAPIAADAAEPAAPEPPPACLPDPFIPVGPNEFKLAGWLEGGSPCAYLDGLPSTGNAADDLVYDDDYSGNGVDYLTVKRAIPPGTYSIGLAAADCRTHQFGDSRTYDQRTLAKVKGADRDVFSCLGIPVINCNDCGGYACDCYVMRTEYLCSLTISVAADGTVSGAGHMTNGAPPINCQ